MFSRSLMPLRALGALTILAGCARTTSQATIDLAPAARATEGTPGTRVVSSDNGQTIQFAALADAAARADVVFFGEQHDDDETHRAELALLKAIGQRRQKVVLSLEMFERDVQPVLDSYLAGSITEEEFRARSRPWPNYAADYRPLVEWAKSKGWPVIAANVPRPLASMVSKRGLPAVDSLPAADRANVAAEIQCPKDKYYDNFIEVMGGHSAGGAGSAPTPGAPRPMAELFYEAQCIKDETMAESIARARQGAGRDAIVVHYNGSFHSDFGLGTAARVRRRLASARTVVISAVPSPTPDKAKVADVSDRGQFILFTLRTKP
jgi:uncharacterized iron-regulated protein